MLENMIVSSDYMPFLSAFGMKKQIYSSVKLIVCEKMDSLLLPILISMQIANFPVDAFKICHS